MSALPSCPKCTSEHVYEDGALLVCRESAHEWSAESASAAGDEDVPRVIKDADRHLFAGVSAMLGSLDIEFGEIYR